MAEQLTCEAVKCPLASDKFKECAGKTASFMCGIKLGKEIASKYDSGNEFAIIKLAKLEAAQEAIKKEVGNVTA